MKRFLTIGIFLTVLTMVVTAQNTFSGLVKDTKGQAIPFATVQILKTDSTLVTGAITDDDGKYTLSFSSEETQKYLLHVSFVGYKTQVLHLDSKATDIRDIVLEEEATELSEVEVSAKRPLVERQVDKLVLNVSDSPFAIGSNGEELLKKAPGVNIDKDGNITVNGQSVAVYIDGRPSYLSGEQLKAMLESTDGSTIDKIEIITHPSSKYDAAGSGGIINIKTKRNMTRGVNGTLSTTYGGMYFSDIDKYLQRDNVSLNLHLRTEKTYTSLALTQNYNSGANTMETGSKVDDGNTAPLERYTQSRRLQTYQWYRLKISNDWFVDKKNTIGFIFNMPLSKWETEQNPQHNYSYLFRANDTLSSGTSDIKNLYKWRQYSSNINYTHIFNDSLDQEITFNLDYNRHSDDGNTNSLTESYSPSMPASHLKLHLNTDNYVNIYSAKADFQTNVWRTGKIEAGAKWSMTYTHNRLKTDSTINNTDQRPQKTTAFNYNEQIAALYFSIANRFGEHWNAKVGLRGEFTNSKGDWISADSTTQRSYFNLFPTAFVGYNPNQKMSFNLSYNRRIQRPSYDELNPFEDYTDAYTYQVGNPQLKPEFVHQAALDMNFTQYVSLEGGMLYGTDLVNGKTDVLEGGITRTKPYNAGTVTAAFVGLSLTEMPIVPKMETDEKGKRKLKGAWLALTAHGNYLYVKNNLKYPVVMSSHLHRFYMQGTLTSYLPKDWTMAVDGWYVTRQDWGYNVYAAQGGLGASIKKKIKEPNMTFSVQIWDIFRTGRYKSTQTMENYSAFHSGYYHPQKVSIGLVWNFGKQQYVKYRNVGNTEEESRIGSGGGNEGNKSGGL